LSYVSVSETYPQKKTDPHYTWVRFVRQRVTNHKPGLRIPPWRGGSESAEIPRRPHSHLSTDLPAPPPPGSGSPHQLRLAILPIPDFETRRLEQIPNPVRFRVIPRPLGLQATPTPVLGPGRELGRVIGDGLGVG